VANIGFSPTFDDHIFTVEVYILDFEEDIYGQKIRVNFVKRLRDEKKFSSVAELAEKIQNDVKEARAALL
jgi:riboflavin kinase/FMN adenylyltransferase